MNTPKYYSVQGMKCDGCRTKIESALIALPQIEQVSIDLKSAQASIHFFEPISLKKLNESLAETGQFQLVAPPKNFFSSLFNF